MKTLKKRLQEGIKNIYLLQGEDYYLYDRAFLLIKKATALCYDDFNLSVFDDENFSIDNVLSSLESLPVGGEYRIIVCKNISKLTEKDKSSLLEYAKNPCPSSVLVVYDFLSKFDFIKPFAQQVDLRRFDRKTATAFLVNEFAKKEKQISEEAANTLLDYCNGYLTRAVNEIDKLVYYDMSNTLITKKLVENVVTKDNEFVIFELTEALGRKNGDKVLQILDELSKTQGVLGLITNHFRRLFFIAISALDDKSLASMLDVKEYAITKQRAQAKNFSALQLKKIFNLLEEVDFNIKSGAMLQENALYFLNLSILYI